MREYLRGSRVLPEPRWFCLWLPLRRAEHYAGTEPISRSSFDDLSGPPPLVTGRDLPCRLAEILPLLTRVAGVRCWCDDGNGAVERWAVRLSEDAVCRESLETMVAAQPAASTVRW